MTTNPFSDLPILDLDAQVDPETEGSDAEAPRTVLITGAGGNLGKKLSAAWADSYELIRIDQKADPDDPDLIVADISQWDDDWTCLFDEADTVVHLAANPAPTASWADLQGPNLDAMANVLLAAAQAGIDRVIFASSCHVMGGYRQAGATGPITADMPPRPDNDYGASKLAGERMGRGFASAFGLSFVAVRVGWVEPGENRFESLPDVPEHDRSIWLSNGDLVRLFTRAVEAELEEGSVVVVHGRSDVQGSRWSLTEAARMLGFVPGDRV